MRLGEEQDANPRHGLEEIDDVADGYLAFYGDGGFASREVGSQVDDHEEDPDEHGEYEGDSPAEEVLG